MNSGDEGDGNSRRSFLLSTGGLLTTAWVATQWIAISAAAHHAAEMAGEDDGAPPAWTGFQFLTPAEAPDVDAIAAQIIPSGDTAGAREARAVHFIDRSLATFFSGWAAEFRRGLDDFQTAFRTANPSVESFAAADAPTQIAHLRTVDRTPFFASARMLTVLGMFSSPKYGGNFEGAGWKMMGFEDRHVFAPPFGYYDAHYSGFVPYADKPA